MKTEEMTTTQEDNDKSELKKKLLERNKKVEKK